MHIYMHTSPKDAEGLQQGGGRGRGWRREAKEGWRYVCVCIYVHIHTYDDDYYYMYYHITIILLYYYYYYV